MYGELTREFRILELTQLSLKSEMFSDNLLDRGTPYFWDEKIYRFFIMEYNIVLCMMIGTSDSSSLFDTLDEDRDTYLSELAEWVWEKVPQDTTHKMDSDSFVKNQPPLDA